MIAHLCALLIAAKILTIYLFHINNHRKSERGWGKEKHMSVQHHQHPVLEGRVSPLWAEDGGGVPFNLFQPVLRHRRRITASPVSVLSTVVTVVVEFGFGDFELFQSFFQK
ncbi:transmembrane protein, putative [Medicago truncatula]|uniref:Transmembrane protein, putative n=1 Tax=Medicago truncatula TaxID=3880 RepID=A0A072VQ68_MEDTR|nr:transmembrane protein, putative [Medicago truncatula]